MSERVEIGRVGRAHGLDGAVHVTGLTDRALLAPGVELWIGEHECRSVELRGSAADPLLRVTGVDDRTAAAALTGAVISVARDAAPELEPGEWYARDLIGLAVYDVDPGAGAAPIGTVTALVNAPSVDILEVAAVPPGDATRSAGAPVAASRPGGDSGTLLVPMVLDAIRGIDLAAGRVEVSGRFLGLATRDQDPAAYGA